MQGSLTGDLSVLVAFGERIGKMGSPAAMRGLNAALGDEALNLIQQGFAKQQDPYGRPWFPKRFPDGKKILRSGGALEKSWFRSYVGPDVVIVTSRARHAVFAQRGTGIFGPSRQRIHPKTGRALRFRGPGGGFIFRKSVAGSPARMMVPTKAMPSLIWNRALRARALAYLRGRQLKAA